MPADLGLGSFGHGRTERLGDQLPPEADADDVFAPRNCLTDQRLLWCEPWILGLFVNIHGAAHNKEAVEIFDPRQCPVLVERVATKYVPTPLCPVCQRGRPLKWYVL